MTKISIITINYNDKNGLQKTIDSVVNQTFKDFEFIVIDGNSTDGSKEVIEQNVAKINYWVSEKDKGVYNAQNKGIRASSGEFVIFMNAGDAFENQLVLEKVSSILNNDFDIYYGNNYKVNQNGSKRLKTYPKKLDFSFFYTSSLNHQSTFIRKSLFEKYFYYNENYKISSDWEFFIFTICKENLPYKHMDITICNYDFTGMSSTGKYEEITKTERNQTLQKYFPSFIDDYKQVNELNSKRIKQFFTIKENKFLYKILKAFLSFLMLFVSKK